MHLQAKDERERAAGGGIGGGALINPASRSRHHRLTTAFIQRRLDEFFYFSVLSAGIQI